MDKRGHEVRAEEGQENNDVTADARYAPGKDGEADSYEISQDFGYGEVGGAADGKRDRE